MMFETLREVKAHLSRIINDLPKTRSVVITKNGHPCAVMLPVTEESDLESILLAHNPKFWRLLDQAHAEGERKGFIPFDDLPD